MPSHEVKQPHPLDFSPSNFTASFQIYSRWRWCIYWPKRFPEHVAKAISGKRKVTKPPIVKAGRYNPSLMKPHILPLFIHISKRLKL